ncbi:MAG: bifunctional nuclease family protein [Bacteroidales bacterium]
MEDKIKLSVLGVTPTQTQTGAYALILGEEEGTRRLPIIIGPYEAQGIIVQCEDIKPSRPLTIDLLAELIERMDLSVLEVSIVKIENGVFHSDIKIKNKIQKTEIVMNSRTSDAIQLALKLNIPIYTNESVMKKAGITMHEIDKSQTHYQQQNSNQKEVEKADSTKTKAPERIVPDGDFSRFSDSDLRKHLSDAIEREDYEMAELLKDELLRRSLPH